MKFNPFNLLNVFRRIRFHRLLNSERKKYYNKTISIFRDKAIEAHVHGSIARGDTDPYSDIDLWFTFRDEDFQNILSNRNVYFSEIGKIIQVLEPPQNRPVKGLQSSSMIKTSAGLLMIDMSFCPISTSYRTSESKALFGDIDLPIGDMGYNMEKVTVADDYRINFVISFVFGSIKKIIRKQENPLSVLFEQYENLYMKYGINVDPLIDKNNTFVMLKLIINNLIKVSNDRQKNTLLEISNFISKIEVLEN